MNKLSLAGVPDATYQVSWKSACWFRRRRFLKGFYLYWYGGHLGHVTSIMSSVFYFLVPESFHKKMVQIGKVVSEKIRFEFLHVNDLGVKVKK